MGVISLSLFFVVAVAMGGAKVINSGYDNDYDSGSSGGDYGGSDHGGSDHGGSDYGGSDYGSSDDYKTSCKPYYDTEVVDRCEHYSERVCYTSQQESCNDIEEQVCRAIVSGKQYRKCFNVTELLCTLKEEIRYDVVQAVFTVQKCHKATERVCDTVYEPQFTNRDDFQCIKVTSPYCYAEDKTVIDKTCRTTTKFDCSQNHYGSSNSYGSSGDAYGSSDAYGSGGDSYGSEDSYDDYEPTCTQKQETKCYNTPRSVTHQVCEARDEKVCEKLNEKTPIPAEKQVCHDEEKKVCELEQRQQPKQIKKYVYTKQCRSVARRVCENADSKQLVPSCVPTTRKQCYYSPVENCEDVPKQYCYKFHKKVKKQKCETVKAGYGSDDSYSSGDDYSK